MKELKKAEWIYSEKFDINIKPYLDSAEIELMVSSMLEQDNMVLREMIKKLMIIKFCTDIENPDEIDYDLAMQSGLIEELDKIVRNSYDIDYIVEQSESVNISVKKFLSECVVMLNKVETKIPKGKQWNTLVDKLIVAVQKNDNK